LLDLVILIAFCYSLVWVLYIKIVINIDGTLYLALDLLYKPFIVKYFLSILFLCILVCYCCKPNNWRRCTSRVLVGEHFQGGRKVGIMWRL